MSVKKTENRGGRRPGSGRKLVLDLGRRRREEIIKQVEAEAKANGTSFGEQLGKLMFGVGGDKRLKLAAMQLYAREILPRVREGEASADDIKGPAIYLPEQRPELEPIEGG